MPISAVMESAADAKFYSDLVEDHVATEISFGPFLDGDARNDGRFFVHNPSCNAATGCNCSFARLNCSEIIALTENLQDGMAAILPDSMQQKITISANEKNIFGIISVFFGAVTARNSTAANTPKPTSGIRIMTTGDAGRCFWGPDGIWSRTTDICVKAAAGFRALVARQAAAILRLRGLLAEQRAAAAAHMEIAAEAIAPGAPVGAPPARPRPPSPPPAAATAAGPPPPAQAAPTLDQLRPLLRAALKIPKPRYQKPTIDGGLNRSTLFRRRQNCAPMTDLWMENCGFATNETVPARIVAASLDPKILKAAGRLVAGWRVRSAT